MLLISIFVLLLYAGLTAMNPKNISFYNFAIAPGTRDHKGYFVQDGTYSLVRVEDTGWAFICQDNHTCYYVDPESLSEVCDLEDHIVLVEERVSS